MFRKIKVPTAFVIEFSLTSESNFLSSSCTYSKTHSSPCKESYLPWEQNEVLEMSVTQIVSYAPEMGLQAHLWDH